MSPIEQLRQQHTSLPDQVKRIVSQLQEDTLPARAEIVCDLLAELARDLEQHVTNEERILYPELARNGNAVVLETSRQFIVEMGELSASFSRYQQAWSDHTSIAEFPAAFIVDTEVMVAALSRRLDREDSELFVLVDP